MSTCRALTNACGNAVGSFVVAAWEGVLDREAMARTLGPKSAPVEAAADPALEPA